MNFIRDFFGGVVDGLVNGAANHLRAAPTNGRTSDHGRIERLCGELGWAVDEREGNVIRHNEDCNTWQEIEEALQAGLLHAFRGKQERGDKTISLLVHAVDYYFATWDLKRFVAIVTHVAGIALPARFAKVVVAQANAAEAALVPGLRVVGAPSLAGLLAWLRGEPPRRGEEVACAVPVAVQ